MRFHRPSRERSRRSSLLSVVAVAVWTLLPARPCCAEEADWRPTRFRVTLRSAEPVAWRGVLALSEGRLERLQSINYEPHAAAGTSLDRGRVRLHYGLPLATDVFDITARCPAEAELVVRLGPEGETARLAIAPAREARQSARIDALGAEIQIDRLASDRIRIETDRKSLLFSPGEEFAFTAVVDPGTEAASRAYDLEVTLSRGRSGEEVWRSEATRIDPREPIARTPIKIPLSDTEGVYRVAVVARRPSGFLDRFPALSGIGGATNEPVLLKRTFQVAVHDASQRPPRLGGWREAYTFDPRVHRWADRLPEWMRWRRLPWFASGPISSDSRTDLQAEGGGAIEIAPAAAGGAHWRAYPLPVKEVGSAYAVEVETLGEPGDRLTIAVLEPDALGDLRALGTAVTLTEPRWNRDQPRPPQRLLIRPRTDSPLLVIANPDADRPARFGRIRLLKSWGSGAGVLEETPTERVVALDWPDSDLPHAVGASHAGVREASYQPYEVPDLVTYYETAIALADRVEAAGANAAVVPVNQNGAAIFPSRVWGSPYYDLGVWSDGSADLPRRELLAMIAREFRRRGLKLVPTLRFDAPTAFLEAAPTEANYDPAAAEPTRLRGAAVVETLNAMGDPGVLAGVAVRASPGGWGLLHQPPNEEQSAERLALGYRRLAEYLSSRAERKPLLILPAEATDDLVAATELTPRLGETSQAAAAFLSRTGLAELAPSGLVATPFGAPQEPLTALRRVLPGGVPHQAYAMSSGRQPVRLIASAVKLRNAAGKDLRLPSLRATPQTEAALLARAVAADTPLLVLHGQGTAGMLNESTTALRSAFAALPIAPADDATEDKPKSDAQDVAASVRPTADGASLATVTNRSAWRRRVQLTVTTPSRVQGERLFVEGERPEWFEAGRHALDLELAPHETAAWRFSGSGVEVDGVRLEPAPVAQRELAASLADLQSRDTTVRRPVELIRNPSFELDSADGSGPTGWRVRGETTRVVSAAIDGTAAVRLRSSSEQAAELISDPFPTPTTGQLAIFLRTQAVELGEGGELKIEIVQPRGDYRRSTRLGPDQLSVVDEDGWSPFVLFPLDDLPLVTGGKLELRVSLTGEAEVLVDELRTEDLILPLDGYGPIEKRAEKFALVRLMTTGEKLLSEGRLEACREVLDSYWAGFLRDNFPQRGVDPIASTEAPAEPAEEPEADPSEKPPSVSERLRGYLPRWWR